MVLIVWTNYIEHVTCEINATGVKIEDRIDQLKLTTLETTVSHKATYRNGCWGVNVDDTPDIWTSRVDSQT